MLGIVLLVLSIIVNAGITLWIVALRWSAIKRDKTYIEEIQLEIKEFMAALEHNVSGYVAVMDKVRHDADTLLDDINRKLRVVERESQKLEQSKRTYNDLYKHKPIISSIIDIQKNNTSKEFFKDETEINTERYNINHFSSKFRENNESSNPKKDGIVLNTAFISTKNSLKGNTSQVASMWRDGKDAKEIAEKLNLSMGEVELALALTGSRR